MFFAEYPSYKLPEAICKPNGHLVVLDGHNLKEIEVGDTLVGIESSILSKITVERLYKVVRITKTRVILQHPRWRPFKTRLKKSRTFKRKDYGREDFGWVSPEDLEKSRVGQSADWALYR